MCGGGGKSEVERKRWESQFFKLQSEISNTPTQLRLFSNMTSNEGVLLILVFN
jgi:hypothetical protein